MSLSHLAGDRPVHFPANPDRFAFDGEVAQIFPDMAVRSIPNFVQAHEAHARMLAPILVANPQVQVPIKVLDIGASRGAFLEALVKVFGMDRILQSFDYHAIDNSPDMVVKMQADFPFAKCRYQDILDYRFNDDEERYDVVVCNYVLQFVPVQRQMEVLRAVMRKVRRGGVLIYGHKAEHTNDAMGRAAHEEYIRFRMENGYSREEIQAKTAALKGSMHPMGHERLLAAINGSFRSVQETFRFMMFCTFMAVK